MPAKRSKSIVFGRRMSEDGVGVEADFLRGEERLSISGVVFSFVWLKKN